LLIFASLCLSRYILLRPNASEGDLGGEKNYIPLINFTETFIVIVLRVSGLELYV